MIKLDEGIEQLVNKDNSVLNVMLIFLFNIAYTIIIVNIVAKYNESLIPDTNIVVSYVLANIVSYILLTYLYRSYVLGLLNLVLLIYVSKALIMEYLLISIILAIIIAKKIGFEENLLSLTRTSINIKIESIDPIMILRIFSVIFAGTAVSLPIAYLAYDKFFLNPTIYYELIIGINLSLTLVLALLSRNIMKTILASLLIPFTYYSSIIIAYMIIHFITRAIHPDLVKLYEKYYGKVYLGRLEAVLVKDKPRNPHPILKHLEKSRRKIWYWRKTTGFMTIDPEKLPNRHTIIVGASGMGKSMLAKHLVTEMHIKYGYNFVILDPHGEYSDIVYFINDINILDASKVSINPLELYGRDPRIRAHELSYIIQSLFRLGHLQRQLLEEIIVETYKSKGIYPDRPSTWSIEPPSFIDLVRQAEIMGREDELARRVLPYLKALMNQVFSSSSRRFIEIITKPTIILLDKLVSDYIRSLYITSFLYKVSNYMYTRSLTSRKLIIVLDEAHNILRHSAGRNILSKLLMESRKYGLGIIIISQQPLSIPEPIYQNSAIRISFNTSEPRSNKYLSRLLAGEDDKERLSRVSDTLRRLEKHRYILSMIGVDELALINISNIIEAMNKVKNEGNS